MAPAAFLPEELFREEILMRLPIKSLVRFRCVCKLLNSLFYDSDFTRSHYNRSISQKHIEDDYLILSSLQSPYVLSILSRNNLSETCIQYVPDHDMDLLGSINGLVCLTYFDQSDYYFKLWNPVTSLTKTILVSRNYDRPFGFGWDSVTDDIKLIAGHANYSPLYYVYSCKTNTWSDKYLSHIDIPKCPSPCVVNGIPYWNIDWDSRILKFDVRTNEFSYLEVHPDVFGSFSLVNMNDSLALIECAPPYVGSSDKCSNDLYRFNEEGNFWSKMYTTNLNICKFTSMFKYGGEILFNGKNNLYCPKSNEIKTLSYNESSGDFVQGISYTPSLLAP